MRRSTLQHLDINGRVSVKPSLSTDIRTNDYCVAVMGPTGAGKSSFIEALAGKHSNLKISKDQLDGYTQTVDAYLAVNVETSYNNRRLFIIDTPGFSDSKISEFELIATLNTFLKGTQLSYIDHIYYFIPITRPRLEGTKRRTISLIKNYVRRQDGYKGITFVTTMWDTLHTDNLRQRAQSNFEQLRDSILKDSIHGGATLEQFDNTQKSALRVLDRSMKEALFGYYLPSPPPLLYRDLYVRIRNLMTEQRSLAAELAALEVHNNYELHSILSGRHKENEELFIKFSRQLGEFGKPPRGCEGAHYYLIKSIQYQADLALALFAQLPFNIRFSSQADAPQHNQTHSNTSDTFLITSGPPSPGPDCADKSEDLPSPESADMTLDAPTAPKSRRFHVLKVCITRLISFAKPRAGGLFKRKV